MAWRALRVSGKWWSHTVQATITINGCKPLPIPKAFGHVRKFGLRTPWAAGCGCGCKTKATVFYGAARTKAYRRHRNTSQSCIPPSVACPSKQLNKQHHEAVSSLIVTVTSDSAADLKHELTRPPATLWQLARTSSCCPCVWNWSPGFLQVLRRCRTHSPCWRWLQPVGRLPLNHHKSQP